MFGSLRIDRRRLSEDQQALYRASFCASCHAHHDLGGRVSSLLTNYDQTVLTLVAASLSEEVAIRLPCTALPWRGVGVRPLSAETQDYLAAVNVLAITAKLRDDQMDEGRLRSRVGLRVLRRQDRLATTALHRQGFPVSIFEELPAQQAAAERATDPSLHSLAGPSRVLGGQMFAYVAVVAKRDGYASVLRRFGEALTTWVYLWDAVIDAKSDQKHVRFNALAAVYGWEGALLQSEVAKHEVHHALHDALDQARTALVELPGVTTHILDALILSLTAKTDRRFGAVPLRSGDLSEDRRAEAGDCDCGVCDCGTCAGGGDCCDGGAYCCHCDACCYGDSSAKEKRKLRKPGETFDPNQQIGNKARVTKALRPDGRIMAGAVELDAVSVDGHLPVGAPVIIEGFEQRGDQIFYRVRLRDDS